MALRRNYLMNNNPENGTVSEGGGAEMSDAEIGAMLMGEDLPAANTPEHEPEETDFETPETEEIAAEADAETVDEGEPEADFEVEQSEAEIYAEPTAMVKLPDGKVISVDELTQGSLRQGDYSRKTQVTAKKLEELQGYEAQLIEHAKASRASNEAVKAYLAQTAPPIPEQSLSVSNPSLYVQQLAARQEFEKNWHANEARLAGDTQRLDAVSQQQKQRDQAQFVTDLHNLMPQLKSPETAQAFAGEVTKVAAEYGFTEEALLEFRDPQVFRLLDRLNTLEKAEAARSRGKAKAKNSQPKPGVIKGSKQRAGGKSLAAANVDKRIKQAIKSGRPEDVDDIFEQALFGK